MVSTRLHTLLVAQGTRGLRAVESIGVSGGLDDTQVTVHDRLAMYWNHGTLHGLRGAHLLR